MRQFSTETGSEYQIDVKNRKIRRLAGEHSPTRNQGPDGAWQPYLRIEPPEPARGQPLLIIWRVEVDEADEAAVVWGSVTGTIRRTLTSRIQFVSEEH